jgi:uncharacterized lipoprotein YmbA
MSHSSSRGSAHETHVHLCTGSLRRRRSVPAALLVAVQLWLIGCASIGPRSVPSKRELVSMTFAEPRPVPGSTGDRVVLYSVVGVVERVAADTVVLLVAGALLGFGLNYE